MNSRGRKHRSKDLWFKNKIPTGTAEGNGFQREMHQRNFARHCPCMYKYLKHKVWQESGQLHVDPLFHTYDSNEKAEI